MGKAGTKRKWPESFGEDWSTPGLTGEAGTEAGEIRCYLPRTAEIVLYAFFRPQPVREAMGTEYSESARWTSEFEESVLEEQEIRTDIFAEPLSRVPLRPLLTLDVTATVADAIGAMNERHVGVTIIVEKGKLAGIFTERDVLRKIAGRDLDPSMRVSKVMTPNPETLPEHAPIAQALHKMNLEGYRHIPLVDAEFRPIGVVGVRDIVAWLVELFPQSLLNLPPEPIHPRNVDGG